MNKTFLSFSREPDPLELKFSKLAPTANAVELRSIIDLIYQHVEQTFLEKINQSVISEFIDRANQEAMDSIIKRIEFLELDKSEFKDFSGLIAAEKKGNLVKDKLLLGEGMLSSDEASKILKVSRETLNNRRRKSMVAVERSGKRGYRYPSWQLDPKVLPHLEIILSNLQHLDDWGQYFFFVEPEPLLKGKTPLHVLQEGNPNLVLAAAAKIAADVSGPHLA